MTPRRPGSRLGRRTFLGAAAATALHTISCRNKAEKSTQKPAQEGAKAESGKERPLPVLPIPFGSASFDVTDRSALLWTRATEDGPIAFEISDRSDFSSARRVEGPPATQASDRIVAVDVGDLEPETRYYARPVARGSVYGSSCRFTTAPESRRSIRVAWSADLLASRQPFTILDQVRRVEPDLFLILGDCTYANHPKDNPAKDLASFRQKHRDVRQDPALQRLLADVPTVAIWDDHDTENNTHREHPLLAPSRQAFRDFWPVRAQDPKGSGLYRKLSYGPLLDLFIVDTRSFRDPPDTAGPKSTLGKAQKDWLKAALSASSARSKILVTSIPFLSPFGSDAWFGFQGERDEIRSHITRERIAGVTILSGDFHMAWDLEDRETHIREFIAGPLAAWPFEQILKKHLKEVRRSGRFAVTDRMNFGVVELQDASPGVTVRFLDDRGGELYRTSFG